MCENRDLGAIKEKMLEELKKSFYDYFFATSRIRSDVLYLNYVKGVCVGASLMAAIAGIPEKDIDTIIKQAKELAVGGRTRFKHEFEAHDY